MKLTNIVFCLMLLGGGLTSCIREDLDDCFSTNKLVLSYKGDGDKEIFPDKICRVEMYVFNAENQCVNSSVLPEDQVKSRTALLPPLEAGEYRIICLGNTHHTKVDRLDAGDYGQMRFAAEDYLAGNTVSGNVRLRQSSGDEPLAEVNLAEFLAANPIIDCTKQEVLIPIRIEFKEGQITVSVPEWYVEQVKPEF